jgi:3-oxoadipate enol-lactonase
MFDFRKGNSPQAYSNPMTKTLKLPDGIDLSYYDSGSGEPLVFLHSFGHTKAMWAPQLNYFLQQGYRVIAPDMRGYGESGYVAANYSIGTFAEDVARLIRELGLQKPTVTGISMGGYTALGIQRRYPNLLGALVLSNTKAEADSEEIKARRRSQIQVLKEQGVPEFVRTSASRRLSPVTLKERPWVLDYVSMLNLTVSEEVLAATLQAMIDKEDDTTILSAIKIPTLVIYGTDDTFIPKPAAPFMHEKISGSKLVAIEGTGHVSSLENPGRYNAALLDFLVQNKGKATT